MKEDATTIETLLKKAVEYSKTSYEVVRLKSLDKTSDVVSSFISNMVVFVLLASFLLFLSIGAALWLGDILGNVVYGFLSTAAFYGIIGIIFRVFFYTSIKRMIENRFIKKALK